MADLLSASDKLWASGAASDLFDSFLVRLVVQREPVKIFAQQDSEFLPGYGDPANQTNYTYSYQSGIFSGVRIYKTDVKDAEEFTPVRLELLDNQIAIRVKEDARKYIKEGAVQNIIVDDNTYNLLGGERPSNLCGFRTWYYKLEATN